MDVDRNETTEVIDLCTPNVDISDIPTAPIVLQNTSTTTTTNKMIERFPNLPHLMSILACYPANNKLDHGEPLLSNIPRM